MDVHGRPELVLESHRELELDDKLSRHAEAKSPVICHLRNVQPGHTTLRNLIGDDKETDGDEGHQDLIVEDTEAGSEE